MTKDSDTPDTHGAEMNFESKMSYTDYLCLEAHDEMLFIVQHQTSELWMQLAIHELYAARNAIKAD